MNIQLQPRDYEIFDLMSSFGFVSRYQLAGLLDPNGKGPSEDLSVYHESLKARLHKLKSAGLIDSGPAPSPTSKTYHVYFLTSAGAQVIKDHREIESRLSPDWLKKKRHFVWTQGAHDLVAVDVLANLCALSKLNEDFEVSSWIGSRDCRFYIETDHDPLLFNPDLYFKLSFDKLSTLSFFVEVDTGSVSYNIIRRKANRFFRYYASDRYQKDLGQELFPRSLWIVRSEARLKRLLTELAAARKNYSASRSREIRTFPFYLATYDDIDALSVEECRVSDKILDPVWRTLDGELDFLAFKPRPSPVISPS